MPKRYLVVAMCFTGVAMACGMHALVAGLFSGALVWAFNRCYRAGVLTGLRTNWGDEE